MQLNTKFFHKHIMTEDICPSSYFSSKSCCICTLQGSITKELCDLHRVDKLNFAASVLLKLVISHVLGSVHRLVSHVLGAMH